MSDDETSRDFWQTDDNRLQAHYSSISLHRKCAEAWYFKYELKLREDKTEVAAPERDFGSWFGAMQSAEALERGRKFGSLIGEPNKFRAVDGIPKFDAATVTVAEVFDAAKAWWKLQSDEAKGEWDARLGEGLPQRLKGAYVRWMDRWAKERLTEQPMAVEMFWQRELPRPEGDTRWDQEAGQLRLNLIGYIDLLYRDTQRDIVVVRDGKTSKSLGSQSALDDMMDSQLQIYPWGVTPALKALGIEAPRAISYDRTKSTKNAQPKLLDSGGLSTTSKNWDLRDYREWIANHGPLLDSEGNQIYTDEGKPAYGARGRQYKGRAKDGSGAGTYVEDPEVVARITSPAFQTLFHQRTLTPISQPLVQAHLRSAVDTTTDIWRTKERARIAGDAARAISKSACTYCEYLSLCRARMFGGPEGEYELAEHKLKAPEGKTMLTLEGLR